MKTRHSILAVILLCCVVFLTACGAGRQTALDTSTAPSDESTAQLTESNTKPTTQTDPNPAAKADWRKFEFTLNGVTLSLPMTIEEFAEKTRFYFEEKDVGDMLRYTDGKCTVNIYESSYDEADVPMIGGISFGKENFLENPNAFSLPYGLGFGSSLEEFTNVFGSPPWGTYHEYAVDPTPPAMMDVLLDEPTGGVTWVSLWTNRWSSAGW